MAFSRDYVRRPARDAPGSRFPVPLRHPVPGGTVTGMRNTTAAIRPHRKTVIRPSKRRPSRNVGGGSGKGAGASQSSGPATDYSKLTGDASFE